MHARLLFHNFFEKTFSFLHAYRRSSLEAAVDSCCHGATLSLTSIGRHLQGSAHVKHKIKRIDRLLGNHRLYHERFTIYQAMAQRALSGLKRAVILIDWSAYQEGEEYILQANLAAHGRTLPLYAEMHPGRQQGTEKIHQQFLTRLHALIPPELPVVIVTDAGFTTKWFKYVRSLGWDFVGRIPSYFLFRFSVEHPWRKVNTLLPEHPLAPQAVGWGELARSNSLYCQLLRYKELPKYRHKVFAYYRSRPLYPDAQARYRRNYQTAWMIVSSLQTNAKEIVSLYRRRMQIEQHFRDLKNPRWGLALQWARTESIQRRELLLLIANLTLFMLWIIGWIAEQQGWHRHYQANSIKSSRVLSFIYLGWQVLFHQSTDITGFTHRLRQALPAYLNSLEVP